MGLFTKYIQTWAFDTKKRATACSQKADVEISEMIKCCSSENQTFFV
jgi:hypothetical protein